MNDKEDIIEILRRMKSNLELVAEYCELKNFEELEHIELAITHIRKAVIGLKTK